MRRCTPFTHDWIKVITIYPPAPHYGMPKKICNKCQKVISHPGTPEMNETRKGVDRA